eukprot:15473779-Alexandrium_andersonii.AAC.1
MPACVYVIEGPRRVHVLMCANAHARVSSGIMCSIVPHSLCYRQGTDTVASARHCTCDRKWCIATLLRGGE